MAQVGLFPDPPLQELRAAFVGKPLHDVQTPAAVLDISKIKSNCKLMLESVANLNLHFRAHVKTHKTAELTRLQVGEDCKDVRLVVSTVVEAEALVPLLKDYQGRGAQVHVLYGLALGASKVSRLASLAKELGPGTVAAMFDNITQLSNAKQFKEESGSSIGVFISVDSGYHREGILPSSDPMVELVKAVTKVEAEGDVEFLGFYSHNSLSYDGNSPDDAMAMLKLEIDVCQQAAAQMNTSRNSAPLVISVGASPTALSIQNIQPAASSSSKTTTAEALLQALNLTSSQFTLEIHAGVYPLFDLQQVAASSRYFSSDSAAHDAQALTILTEVISTYPSRTNTPEALVSAGVLALAREPCKSYPGWAVVTSWNLDGMGYTNEDSIEPKRRMIVTRIAQEHGILGWEDDSRTNVLPVNVGDKVRLWVNHACIANAGFGWYLIVDESKGGSELVIEDVWVKWRGW